MLQDLYNARMQKVIERFRLETEKTNSETKNKMAAKNLTIANTGMPTPKPYVLSGAPSPY